MPNYPFRTVIIAIKEKESLMNSTVTVIMGNLCAANLVSTVFVKSIAVVYHGYAVARNLWEVRSDEISLHIPVPRETISNQRPASILYCLLCPPPGRAGLLCRSHNNVKSNLGCVSIHHRRPMLARPRSSSRTSNAADQGEGESCPRGGGGHEGLSAWSYRGRVLRSRVHRRPVRFQEKR